MIFKAKGLRLCWFWEEIQLGADPNWPKGFSIPDDIMLSYIMGEEGGTVRVMVFIFPRNHDTWWALLSWGWLSTWLPMGSDELIPCFALLVCLTFPLPMKLPCSAHEFSNFCLQILSLILLVGEGKGCSMRLSCWLGLNHNKDNVSNMSWISFFSCNWVCCLQLMNIYEEVHRLQNYSLLSVTLCFVWVDCAWLYLHDFLWKQRDGIANLLFKRKGRP